MSSFSISGQIPIDRVSNAFRANLVNYKTYTVDLSNFSGGSTILVDTLPRGSTIIALEAVADNLVFNNNNKPVLAIAFYDGVSQPCGLSYLSLGALGISSPTAENVPIPPIYFQLSNPPFNCAISGIPYRIGSVNQLRILNDSANPVTSGKVRIVVNVV